MTPAERRAVGGEGLPELASCCFWVLLPERRVSVLNAPVKEVNGALNQTD